MQNVESDRSRLEGYVIDRSGRIRVIRRAVVAALPLLSTATALSAATLAAALLPTALIAAAVPTAEKLNISRC